MGEQKSACHSLHNLRDKASHPNVCFFLKKKKNESNLQNNLFNVRSCDGLSAALTRKAIFVPKGVHGLDGSDNTLVAATTNSSGSSSIALGTKWHSVGTSKKLRLKKRLLAASMAIETTGRYKNFVKKKKKKKKTYVS